MAECLKKPLSMATLAQVFGVSLALLGCVGVFGSNWQWNMWSVLGIVVPFALGYVTFIYGIVVCLRNSTPVDEKKYMFFVRLYLYVDAVFLPIMVAFSGGVKQSLFSPLFFALPAMAVVFVPRSKFLGVVYITVVTLTGYLIVYWLPSNPKAIGQLYRLCECAILVGSVSLTVVMSRQVPSLP